MSPTFGSELIETFKDNIRTLPTGTIMIATADGARPSDALILGSYALNENAEGWTVSHRMSGYAFKNFATPIEALISLGILLGAGMPSEFTIDGFHDIPGMRDIAARIEAAVAILDSWDLDIDYNEPEYSQDV